MVAAFVIIVGEDVLSPFIMFPFMWRKVHQGSNLAFPSSVYSQMAEFRRSRVYSSLRAAATKEHIG